MQTTYVNPHLLLRPYIYHYSLMKGSSPQKEWQQPIIPSIISYMTIRFQELGIQLSSTDHAQTPPVFLIGMTSSAFRIKTKEIMDFAVISFTADGLYKLLGIPSRHFADQLVDYASISPEDAGFLLEQTSAAQTDNGRYEVLDKFFLKLLERQIVKPHFSLELIENAAQRILHHGGSVPVGRLAKELHATKRSMERHFKEILGVSPKTFSKLIRFNASIQQLVWQHPRVSIEEIAWQMGYHDISHFVKEFREFYEKTPFDFCTNRSLMEASCLEAMKTMIPVPVIPDWCREKRKMVYLPNHSLS